MAEERTIIDVDVSVTWRRPDGSVESFPATIAFGPDEQPDLIERYAEAAGEAIRANMIDFPDDIGEGAVPAQVTFT